MDTQNTRMWLLFYLISFVVILLTLFFTTQGIMLGISMTLILVVIGINFYLIRNEIMRTKAKNDLMRRLSKKESKNQDNNKKDNKPDLI